MKIFLIERHYFTFRGQESWELDLCGKSTRTLMQEHLRAPVCTQAELPAGEKIVLELCFPFLTLKTLARFLRVRAGSFSFVGGYVQREGEVQRLARSPSLALTSLSRLRAVRARARVEAARYHAARGALVEEGAEVDFLSELGEGCIVRRGARVERSVLGRGCVVEGESFITESKVGENCRIASSYLSGAEVGNGCTVGPFSVLRAGSCVGADCRIGDFVEVKNSTLGAGVKAAHLSYIGDADVGARVNVGCGAVFANYDGCKKRRSSVGADSFLGCNVNLVAPVHVGEGAYVAAGTTLTRDLDAHDLCIGRSRAVVKAGGGAKYLQERT